MDSFEYKKNQNEAIEALKQIIERAKNKNIKGIICSVEFGELSDVETDGMTLIFGDGFSTMKLTSSAFQFQVDQMQKAGFSHEEIIGALVQSQFMAAMMNKTEVRNQLVRREKSRARGFSKMTFTLSELGIKS